MDSGENTAPTLWIKLVIPGRGAIGPGKIALLRAIAEARSISGAARTLGMSYRRAWTLVDETRRIVGADVVRTRAGGPDGGGAALAPAGRELLSAYDRIARTAADSTESDRRGIGALGEQPDPD